MGDHRTSEFERLKAGVLALVLAIGVLGLVLGGAALAFRVAVEFLLSQAEWRSAYPNGEDTLSPAEVEQWARVQLPPSARNLRTFFQAGRDDLLLVRFELDETDLQRFAAESGLPPPEEWDRAVPLRYLAPGLAWWDPPEGRQPVWFTTDHGAGRSRKVLAVPRGEHLTAYLVASQT